MYTYTPLQNAKCNLSECLCGDIGNVANGDIGNSGCLPINYDALSAHLSHTPFGTECIGADDGAAFMCTPCSMDYCECDNGCGIFGEGLPSGTDQKVLHVFFVWD